MSGVPIRITLAQSSVRLYFELAIGLPGVCVVAGDTRLSVGYNIISREATKLQKLTDKCILATSGMYADFIALKKQLQANLQHYEFQNDKQVIRRR